MIVDPATPGRHAVTVMLIVGAVATYIVAENVDSFRDSLLLVAMTLALVAAVVASPISFMLPSL